MSIILLRFIVSLELHLLFRLIRLKNIKALPVKPAPAVLDDQAGYAIVFASRFPGIFLNQPT